MSAICIVGSDKGGVGKTHVTRLLLDYLKIRHVAPRVVFDTEGGLRRFHSYAKLVDVTKVADKAQIFDGLRENGATVMDMKAGTLSETLADMRENRMLSGDPPPVVLHILGSSSQSLMELPTVNAQLAETGTRHVIVENRQSDADFFKWDEKTRDMYFKSLELAGHIEIPQLDQYTNSNVDVASVPFEVFAKNADGKYSQYLSDRVRTWLDKSYAQLDSAKIADMLRPAS